MTHSPVQLLSQALHAMVAVLPLRTLLWVTTADFWIIGAAGAPLALVGRLTNRHLYQVLESEDPATPMIAGHQRALAGEGSDFEHQRNGRRWRASIAPVTQAGVIVGCFGSATLLPSEQEAAPTLSLSISVCIAPDAEQGLRPGDYILEHPGQPIPAIMQRTLTDPAVARLRREGKLVRVSPRDAALPAAPAVPACADRRTGAIALVRSM